MKQNTFFINVLAIIMVLICDKFPVYCDESSIGEILVLSGQVGRIDTGALFNGNFIIRSRGGGGMGKVENGQLSYIISTPGNLKPIVLGNYKLDNPVYKFDNPVNYASDDTVNIGFLDDFEIIGQRGNISCRMDNCHFIFVDKDVVISGEGLTTSHEAWSGTYTYIYEAFSLSLKKGWNVVFEVKNYVDDENNKVIISTYLGDPNFKPTWIFF